MTQEIHGLKETKEILKFILGLGVGVDNSLGDGKIDVDDFGFLLPALLSAGEAFKDISKVPQELKDLSASELEELSDFIKQEFSLKNKNIERLVEAGLGISIQIYQLILEIQALKKSPPAAV